MKGVAMIIMLLGLLVTAYLVFQDLRARQDHGTVKIQAIEKAARVGDTLQKTTEETGRRMRNIVGD